jgi:hypothetical protein
MSTYTEGERLNVKQLEALLDFTLFYAGGNLLPMTDSHRLNAQTVHDDAGGRVDFFMAAEEFLCLPVLFTDETLPAGPHRLFINGDDEAELHDWLTHYPKPEKPISVSAGFRVIAL